MKNVFSLIIFMVFGISLYAQVSNTKSIKFTYDDGGNRKTRQTIILGGGNGGQQNFVQKANVGTSNVTMTPNPSEGIVNVKVDNYDSDNGSVNVSVFDFSGRLIISKPNIGEQTQLDLTNFPTGSYRLRLIQGTKESVWKLIKL